MKQTIRIFALSFATLPSLVWGNEAVDLKNQEQKYSYVVGYGIGKGMQQNNINVDINAFSAAIADALADKEPRLSEEEMMAVAQEKQQEQIEQMQHTLKSKQEEETKFLTENKTKKGVVALASGLQYKIIEEGHGKKPAATDTVSVHYEGALLTGDVFDSSYQRGVPAEFPVQGVIQGWQEGLQLMKEGAKWKFFIPSNLAYGERGAGTAIGPGETLVFDVELLAIK